MRFFLNNEFSEPLILIRMDLDIDENGVQIDEENPEGYQELLNVESIELYKENFLGKFFGMREWYSLRAELKKRIESIAREDYSNFNSLTTKEKSIALIYLPTKIISSQGYSYFLDACGGSVPANKIILDYLECSTIARTRRYESFVSYAYAHLGALDGLKAERFVREKNLNTQWSSRGVSRKSIDGIDGITDWLKGEQGTLFEGIGLTQDIESGTYTIKSGVPTVDFINNCILILENGCF